MASTDTSTTSSQISAVAAEEHKRTVDEAFLNKMKGLVERLRLENTTLKKSLDIERSEVRALKARNESTLRNLKTEHRRKEEFLEKQLRSPKQDKTSENGNSNENKLIEIKKLTIEIQSLKSANKGLQEKLKVAQAAECARAAELRAQAAKHSALEQAARRDARAQCHKLLEEIKSKERVILQLKREAARTAVIQQNDQGAVPVPDEEMNGGGKRIGRPARTPPTTAPTVNLPDVKLAEGPVAPKHIPFPYIPQDGTLLFEAMTFVFTLVATGLQFLNLYRTAWWLPHSYTNQAMNFYLIDPHLVAFIVTIISRKLLLSICLAILRFVIAPKLIPHATIAARMFILGVVLGALSWCTYFIMLKYPMVKIFYLCYPAVIYFLLFGLQSSPFLELNNADPPLHCCTHDAAQIRTEVEALRQDFNVRMKKIIFNSVVGAYYSSFIPCCFAQSYLYYEVYAASQQTAFVWAGLFARYVSQLVSAHYCDVPHRAAAHLGRWRPDNNFTESNEVPTWCADRMFSRGARVSLDGRYYIAVTPTVAADPANVVHGRFHTVFANPSLLLCGTLCLQLSLIVLQLCLLFSSIQWHNFLAIVILLFINYYTLFKMVRDYLVAWKVYKAENMIQDKNGSLQPVSN